MNKLEQERHALKKKFRYYMEIMWEGSTGKQATNDNYAEWDEIIDGIVELAKAEIKEGKK